MPVQLESKSNDFDSQNGIENAVCRMAVNYSRPPMLMYSAQLSTYKHYTIYMVK